MWIVDMTWFHVDDLDFDYIRPTLPKEGVSIHIVLKRKTMMEMMTTNMLFFLLMMIIFATTFFKPLFFEAALTVNPKLIKMFGEIENAIK